MTTLDLFRRDFVLSIKPEYALKIVEGEKKSNCVVAFHRAR